MQINIYGLPNCYSSGLHICSKDKLISEVLSPTQDTIPSDFPNIVTFGINNPAPGKIYLSNLGTFYPNYLMVLNDDGKPAAYKKVDIPVYDFKVQPNGLLSFALPTELTEGQGWGYCNWLILDTNFNTLDTFQMNNGYTADFHDFQWLPNGHSLMLAYSPEPKDMSRIVINGNPNATELVGVIQELDADKNVVFQWRITDYIDINDTYNSLLDSVIDVSHLNTIEFDMDGNFLLSSRSLQEITKINRTTGNIMWRLGGKKNEFTFLNENENNAPIYFSRQHDVRRLYNTNITLFDNGNSHNPRYSRAVEYSLNEKDKIANMIWEFRHSPDIFGPYMGSVQRLPAGNTLICWGGIAAGLVSVTEVHPDNTIALEVMLPQGVSNAVQTYHAYKYPWKPGALTSSSSISNITKDTTLKFETTGVKIQCNELDANNQNQIEIKRYDWAPINPRFSEPAPIVAPYRLVISQNGINSIKGKIYFALDEFKNMFLKEKHSIYFRPSVGSGTFLMLNTGIEANDMELFTDSIQFGEFIFARNYQPMPPGTPILLSPPNNTILNINTPQVTLKWNPRGYATESELMIATDADYNDVVLNTILRNYTYLFDFEPGKIYFWRIRARNEAGWSRWSETRSFTSFEPFFTITYPNGGETIVRDTVLTIIRWNKNIDDQVKIELFKGGNYYRSINDTLISFTGAVAWLIPQYIEEDSTYQIKVSSLINPELSDMSDGYFKIVNPASTIPESRIINIFRITNNYPNPFATATTIEFELYQPGQLTAKIYDAMGRLIDIITDKFYQAGFHQIHWQAIGIEPGIYICRINSGIETETIKLNLVR